MCWERLAGGGAVPGLLGSQFSSTVGYFYGKRHRDRYKFMRLYLAMPYLAHKLWSTWAAVQYSTDMCNRVGAVV
jgi:hypothetical protein